MGVQNSTIPHLRCIWRRGDQVRVLAACWSDSLRLWDCLIRGYDKRTYRFSAKSQGTAQFITRQIAQGWGDGWRIAQVCPGLWDGRPDLGFVSCGEALQYVMFAGGVGGEAHHGNGYGWPATTLSARLQASGRHRPSPAPRRPSAVVAGVGAGRVGVGSRRSGLLFAGLAVQAVLFPSPGRSPGEGVGGLYVPVTRKVSPLQRNPGHP